MSTKRLSRTVIEGGRYRFNKWARRRSHRKPRHEDRRTCAELARDPDLAELALFERRAPVRRCFYDRLAPAERWLRAQAGRPWRDVEGEILSRFDVRSLAGRHVVYDHLLPSGFSETLAGWRVHRRGTFFVDTAGLLQFAELVRALRTWTCAGRCGRAFAGERLVAKRGERTYWLEPTRTPEPNVLVPYRQGKALTVEERRAYDALCEAGREAITRMLE